MKTIKRFVLGVVSTLLFTVGLSRAADLLDPMSRSLPQTGDAALSATPDSNSECYFADNV